MLKKYTFVGMVDLHLSLLQFNTKLVLVNHTELRQGEELVKGRRNHAVLIARDLLSRTNGMG